MPGRVGRASATTGGVGVDPGLRLGSGRAPAATAEREECYLRCYGVDETTVRVVSARAERAALALRGDHGEELRQPLRGPARRARDGARCVRTCAHWGRTRRVIGIATCRGRSRMSGPARRGAASVAAAAGARYPDVLGPGPAAVGVFCGINPGFVSALPAAHFANPRNDFWRLLARAPASPSRLYEPSRAVRGAARGIGLTNAAPRTTRGLGDSAVRTSPGAAERLERLATELGSRVDRVRRQGGLPRRVQRARRARPAGAAPRRDAAVRAAVDVAGERRACRGRSGCAGSRSWPVVQRVVRCDRRCAHSSSTAESGSCCPIRLPGLIFRSRWCGAAWTADSELGETDEQALRRELAEETGLVEFEVGPCIWTREHWFAGMPGWGGQSERIHLVRVEPIRAGTRS